MSVEEESRSNSPAVVLLSGGMDSAVLLSHVAKDLGCAPIHTLAFDYGQRHRRELACAQWQSNNVGAAAHTVIDFSFVPPLVKDGTALVEGGTVIPDLVEVPDTDRDQPPTYVPNRNMMFLSAAVAYAEAHTIRSVYYGAQAQDEYGYWDCTGEFVERLNATLALNRRDAVTVHAPFVAKKKSALVAMGVRLGVNFAQTWSCYRGGEKACGTCPTCVERLKAFEDAGETDPLIYA